MTTVFVISLTIFALSYFFHKAKLFGVKGYDPKDLKWMKKDKKVHKTKIDHEMEKFAAAQNIELIDVD